MIAIPDIKKAALKIAGEIKPEKIILFGSYAYGSPSKDSDIDICIIEKRIVSKSGIKGKVRGLLSEIEAPKDILVSTVDEYDFYKNQINSVFHDIDKKGLVLWKNI